MSGRLLDFKSYIGGSDNVQVIELFPRSQKTFTYNFNTNVSAYTFSSDYQTIVLDQVTYDRVTGDPNFTETTVIGFMNTTGNVSNSLINNASASTGVVTFTIPQNRYTGKIIPNARDKVVMTVVSFQWTTGDTPAQQDMHRWAIIERWEPGVTPGDPTSEVTYVSLA